MGWDYDLGFYPFALSSCVCVGVRVGVRVRVRDRAGMVRYQ